MSVTVEAEVCDREIIDAIMADPHLICEALRKMSQRRNGGLVYKAALDCLTVDEGTETEMSYHTWANAFAQFDAIAQERALHELWRVAPLLAIWKKP